MLPAIGITILIILIPFILYKATQSTKDQREHILRNINKSIQELDDAIVKIKRLPYTKYQTMTLKDLRDTQDKLMEIRQGIKEFDLGKLDKRNIGKEFEKLKMSINKDSPKTHQRISF